MHLALILLLLGAKRKEQALGHLRILEVTHAALAPLLVDKGKTAFEKCERRLRRIINPVEENNEQAAFGSMMALARKQVEARNQKALTDGTQHT
jgi:hypothetical protein